ncbi:hypothetical protein FJ527_28275 [Mesorhizobium sp. B2-4-18]|uniref:hypothetical protein n=1 Tax=Mesorhizobium sp. B2-4-18 TaxID=2589931 RepID=UPI00112C8AA0|nr:hypothetical protein [Mesorhizobium sp. B2-4-18]TPK70774.1 hypothetical protein FJ527_28275 [Mesorhizobium sp. B2-4-18]
MAWTLDNALEDGSISIVERNDAWGVYKFRVGSLSPVVTVILCRSPVSDETRYERSHNIKTPVQLGPYHQSRLFWDDPAYALHQAVDSITSYYKEAVAKGHDQQDAWLVPNAASSGF